MKFVPVAGTEFSAHRVIFLPTAAATTGPAYEVAQAGFSFSRGASLKKQ